MKHPPVQFTDSQAKTMLEEFIAQATRQAGKGGNGNGDGNGDGCEKSYQSVKPAAAKSKSCGLNDSQVKTGPLNAHIKTTSVPLADGRGFSFGAK